MWIQHSFYRKAEGLLTGNWKGSKCSWKIKSRLLKLAKSAICQNHRQPISQQFQELYNHLWKETSWKVDYANKNFCSISNMNFFQICTVANVQGLSIIMLISISWNSVLNTHMAINQIPLRVSTPYHIVSLQW